jgi:hypothetical protein
VARAGLPEASTAIAIVTARQTIEFRTEATALLGADSGAPRDLLLLNFAITAAFEVFYRGRFVLRRIDMPRASWKGHLRLSLVCCPVYLSPVTARAKSIRLHQVWQASPAGDAGEPPTRHRERDVTDLARRCLIQMRSRIALGR